MSLLENDIVSDNYDRNILHNVQTFYIKSDYAISEIRMLDSFYLHFNYSWKYIVFVMEKSNTNNCKSSNENAYIILYVVL